MHLHSMHACEIHVYMDYSGVCVCGGGGGPDYIMLLGLFKQIKTLTGI